MEIKTGRHGDRDRGREGGRAKDKDTVGGLSVLVAELDAFK